MECADFFWRAEAIFCPSYPTGNRIRVSVNRIDAKITYCHTLHTLLLPQHYF
ncbi:hypothetical protein HMPREF1612_01456 [Escherichia coli 908585]|nr:hypothetical protein HMPREF1606_03984 [Escherichia coli 908522]ESD92740.1 hypothetical protein HMPREF1612_01456 [Escherichia coli 908585]